MERVLVFKNCPYYRLLSLITAFAEERGAGGRIQKSEVRSQNEAAGTKPFGTQEIRKPRQGWRMASQFKMQKEKLRRQNREPLTKDDNETERFNSRGEDLARGIIGRGMNGWGILNPPPYVGGCEQSGRRDGLVRCGAYPSIL